MKAREFADALRAAAPSRDELLAFGLDVEEVEGMVAAFECMPRDRRRADSDALLELLYEYDCSRVEISHVTLVGAVLPHPSGTLVGHWEADPIVLTELGELVVFEHADPATVLVPCARDGASFLDVLAHVADVVRRRSYWKTRPTDAVNLGVTLAGGDAYQRFLCGLLGFLEE